MSWRRDLVRLSRRRLGALLVFSLSGGGLFALDRALVDPPTAEPPRIEITATQVDSLRARLARQLGRDPSPEEERTALEAMIREELILSEARRRGLHFEDLVVRRRLLEKMALLAPEPEERTASEDRFRQALALGLDRDDVIVRRRLVQQMERLAVSEGGPMRISSKQERAFYQKHRDRFMKPRRYGFRHVFIRRGAGSDRGRAVRALRALRGPGAASANTLGDPFPLGSEIPAQSANRIAADFGSSFAAAIATAPVGQWHGPIASSFGWHVVRLDTSLPETPRSQEEARGEILNALREEIERARVEHWVAALRASSEVVVGRSKAEAAT